VMFYLSNILEKLYNDGTLERWGNNIAEIFGKILNYFASLKTAWDAVGEEIHNRIKFFGTMAFALFAGLRTGLLQALISPINALTKGYLGAFATVAAAAFVAGRMIKEFLGLNGSDVALAKKQITDEYYVREQEIFKQYGIKDYSGLNGLNDADYVAAIGAINKNKQAKADALANLDKDAEKFNPKDFSERWNNAISAIGNDFKDISGLGIFGEKMEEIEKIKFPEMPKGKTLPEMLQSGKLVDDLKNAQKLSKFNLRGIYSRINFSPDRIVQNALRVQTPNSRANEQVDYLRKLQLTGAMQTSLTVAQNNILNEIKNNTATKIAVVCNG